ncbi:MAG: uroporphyrinogen decarboxylase family protein [Planctomycetota bacterium]|jgi:uroporphyrinogen decarboxylase
MPAFEGLQRPYQPDGQGLLDTIGRKGTPDRAYQFESGLDWEIITAICERFDLGKDIDPDSPQAGSHRNLVVRRFLGFDYFLVGCGAGGWEFNWDITEDTAQLSRGDRGYMNEHCGPITTWEEFESFPWPDPHVPYATDDLEYWSEHLPEDMVICTCGTAHFCEYLTWLMGYETLCLALYDNRDLVKAISDKLFEYFRVTTERALQFERVALLESSDDMGFKTATLISPEDMREFVLPGHKMVIEKAHAAGVPCVLHSCGNISEIIADLIEFGLDGKHSFEDTIEDVRQVKHTYGRHMALLGGIDVDFLCRADEQAIRQRVRDTLDICNPGGGFCVGSGNTVANYIPLDNYLTMVDEARLYTS